MHSGFWTHDLTLYLLQEEEDLVELRVHWNLLQECYDASIYEEGKIPLTKKPLNQKYKERMCEIIAKHTQSTSLRM